MTRDDDDDSGQSSNLPGWAVKLVTQVAVLTSKVDGEIDARKARAVREWAIILAVLGVLFSVIAKSFKWM